MSVTTSVSAAGSLRRSAAAPWRHIDVTLVAASVVTASLGVLMVYSATRENLRQQGIAPDFYLQRQLIFVLLGVGVMAAMAGFDYRFLRDRAPLLYAGTVGLLVLVLTPLGTFAKGQQASFAVGNFQFQPSEFGKVTLIIALASYLAVHRGEIDGRGLANALGIAAVPLALIYLQPDLGTAMVFVAVILGLLTVGGARPRHLALLAGLGVIAMVLVVHFGVLKQYQLDRLTSFLDPTGDTQRSAYNLAQSKTAIGSGGLFGKGLFQGTQTNLSYVPEQHTDFIFTAVGEQLGLIGSATLLALYAVICWRVWRAGALARDHVGTLMCVGVLAMLSFQIFENAGMTMGIMPITGIPLPLMSYGGSSTVSMFAGIGLVLNVHMRRFS